MTTDPLTIPPSTLLRHTTTTLTIFDKFPKAKYHMLLLPRVVEPFKPLARVKSLQALLNQDKAEALECLKLMKEEAEPVLRMIKDEMMKTHGYIWKINLGFHAVPSMEHLHLHIISSDLVSDSLKNKKHYNSFHPKLGFFLHLDDVLSWFELDDETYRSKAKLDVPTYEKLLKNDLVSWRTDEMYKTMPKLKEHLFDEWKKEGRKSKSKRKRVEDKDFEEQRLSKKAVLDDESD